MYCVRYDVEERQDYDAIQTLVERIPLDQRDSVYVYGLVSCSAWYLQADMLPPVKYCDWQSHYIQLVPEIGKEIHDFLSSPDARWVVTGQGKMEPESIDELLREKYQIREKTDHYCLWEKN